MRYFYNKPYRYRLTRAPRAIRRATLDNIAIVPASMLAGKESLKRTDSPGFSGKISTY